MSANDEQIGVKMVTKYEIPENPLLRLIDLAYCDNALATLLLSEINPVADER